MERRYTIRRSRPTSTHPETGGVLPRSPIDDLSEIRFDGAGIGAGKGAVLGALVGTVVGCAIPTEDEGFLADATCLGAVLTIPLGTLAGFLVGGSSDRVFESASVR